LVYYSSLIIPLLVLIPNLAFFLAKPVNVPAPPLKEPVMLVVLERVGQLGTFISPLFFNIARNSLPEKIAAGGMILMLLGYYFCWIRFFVRRREYRWLFERLFFIPVPLAVFPIVYFLLGAAVTHSLPLLFSAVVFGCGHISISLFQYRYVKRMA
jgi:hypothetical protein